MKSYKTIKECVKKGDILMKRRNKVKDEFYGEQIPAMSEEGRENQLIAMATNLAEKQLREGTASSQVITHFLKLGTQQAKLEKEKLRHETELLAAKKQAIESSERIEKLYADAITAMRSYAGGSPEREENDYE